MRLVMDTCVLFSTVAREVLLRTAAAGAFEPLYSARILDEWAHATARRWPAEAGSVAQLTARLRARWPAGEVPEDIALEESLSLPDQKDRHVLAAGITGGAVAIVTFNTRDFPGRTLGRYGLLLRTPDSVLTEALAEGRAPVAEIAEAVRAEIAGQSGQPQPLRPLLKRAQLPRLGRALGDM